MMLRILTASVAVWVMASASALTLPLPDAASPVTTTTMRVGTKSSGQPLLVAGTCCTIPAGTPITLEILDPITSWQHKRGDKFRIRLVAALIVDGMEHLPAGTLGMGEVVHADAARSGGAPGELSIAARHLNVDNQTIALRGFKLGVTGGDNSGLALGVSFAAGPFAMFIRGREIEIPPHTQGQAKLAHDTYLPPIPAPAEPDPTQPADQPE